MTAHLSIDTSGTFREDVFFVFETSSTDFKGAIHLQWILKNERAIVRKRVAKPGIKPDWLEVQGIPREYSTHYKCPLNAKHKTHYSNMAYEVDIMRGRDISPLIGNDPFAILTPELAAAMKKLSLRGSKWMKMKEIGNGTDYEAPELHCWEFIGDSCLRPRFVVGGENKCPFCGEAPLVCPACGCSVNNHCGKCKARTMCPDDDLHADSRMVRFQSNWWERLILEGRRWDGSDCLSRCNSPKLISKRVLDWLIQQDARPFAALPIRFCTDGMSLEQLEWLKEVTTPFK